MHHTHDASLWPPQGVVYERAVHRSRGAEGATKRFRLRWTENAEHFDGSGSFPFVHSDVDGSAAEVELSTTHAYDRSGTYFATALVHSHRDGDAGAIFRRIPNLAQVRIVVT